ncbi:hypothetical protein ACB092_12G016300 [Castanea dentata]
MKMTTTKKKKKLMSSAPQKSSRMIMIDDSLVEILPCNLLARAKIKSIQWTALVFLSLGHVTVSPHEQVQQSYIKGAANTNH